MVRCENMVETQALDPTGEGRVQCNAPGAKRCEACGARICDVCAAEYQCAGTDSGEHVLVGEGDQGEPGEETIQ